MANSIKVSDLTAYPSTADDIKDNDLFLIASDDSNSGYTSYKLTYSQLYKALLNDISAALESTWKNPYVITTSADVMKAAADGNTISAVGAQPIAQILKYCTGYLTDNLSCARWS